MLLKLNQITSWLRIQVIQEAKPLQKNKQFNNFTPSNKNHINPFGKNWTKLLTTSKFQGHNMESNLANPVAQTP